MTPRRHYYVVVVQTRVGVKIVGDWRGRPFPSILKAEAAGSSLNLPDSAWHVALIEKG
jgi:hypothetical protein